MGILWFVGCMCGSLFYFVYDYYWYVGVMWGGDGGCGVCVVICFNGERIIGCWWIGCGVGRVGVLVGGYLCCVFILVRIIIFCMCVGWFFDGRVCVNGGRVICLLFINLMDVKKVG